MNNAMNPFLDDSILFNVVDDSKSKTIRRSDMQDIFTQMSQLNSPLSALALPFFDQSNDPTVYLQKAYEIIHALLRNRQSEMNFQSKVEEELFKAKSDNEALKIRIQRLQQEVDQRCKQIGQQENQLSLNNKANKSSIEKLQLEKEEFQKVIFKLQQKVTQIQVEMRKKEVEYNKVKEQVKKNTTDKHQMTRNTFEIVEKCLGHKKPDQSINQISGWDTWIQMRKQLIDENYAQKESLDRILRVIQDLFSEMHDMLVMNMFFEYFYQKCQGIFETYNSQRVFLPNAGSIHDYVSEQVGRLKSLFVTILEDKDITTLVKGFQQQNSQQSFKTKHRTIETGRILQSQGLSINESKENQTKQHLRQKSYEKTSTKQHKTSNTISKLKFKSTKHINEHSSAQKQKEQIKEPEQPPKTELHIKDLNSSFVSRISLNDIPDLHQEMFVDSPIFKDAVIKQENKELKKWDFVFKQ